MTNSAVIPESRIEVYCGSTFWDSNLTWWTTSPELTPCFEQTVLVWSPSVFLWLFLPIDLYYIFTSKQRDIPWNFKNISKLVVNSTLVIICIFDVVYVLIRLSGGAFVNYVNIHTPVIKFICLCLCIVLQLNHRKYGKTSSELLCTYWCLVTVLGLPQFRTDFVAFQNQTRNLPALNVTYMMYYLLSVVMFLLNFLADDEPQISAYPPDNKPCPESRSSFPSRLTYAWFDKLALLGFKKPLVNSDLWNLNYSERTSVVSQQFQFFWNQEQSLTRRSKVQTEKKSSNVELANRERVHSGEERRGDGGKERREGGEDASIVVPLWKAFGSTLLIGTSIKLVLDLLSFLSPIILELLIGFVGSDEPMWRGYLYVAALFLNSFLMTLLMSQYYQKMFLTGLHIRTSLMSAIYRKALRISNASRKESAIGEIVNLMAVDSQRFLLVSQHLNMIWSIPLQIALAIYFLWQLLGPSVLAGLAVMMLTIPINGLVASKIKKLQTKQMSSKDRRVNLMNEILSGIKVLKMYAWEPSFEEQVLKIRNKETKVLKHIAYYMSSVAITWVSTPFVVALVTFGIFVLSDEKNVLDAKIAFVSLSLLQILRAPLAMLPITLMESVQAWVSVKRINKFLNLEQLDSHAISHDPNQVDPLVMEKCSFSWGNEGEVVLRDISLRVKEGSLVAVVGAVGSGKSSLLSAFLGEMDKISGTINTKGSMAYVPQLAWIQNATLKDNILFGKTYDETLYRKVVKVCALKQDLEMLPGGDQTEIGEKGINLSGGQKQRVSLARAVYHDSDIYLLDDPLSAVDSHVGKHIFQDVIGPNGVLRNKTRLFVTHGISFLPEADVIVCLKDGTISEIGTYRELMDNKAAFSDFILAYLQETDEAESEQDSKLFSDPSEMKHVESLAELNDLAKQRRRQTSVTSETGSQFSFKSRLSTGSLQIVNGITRAQNTGEKLVEEEKTEIGNVKWSIYKHYFKSMGLFFGSMSIILHVVYEAISIALNIWLAVWSTDDQIYVNGTRDTSRLNNYIIVYTVLGVCQGATSIFTDMVPVLGCWLAGVILHNQLLSTVLRLPLSFFDTTPSGRILSRFSKDVDMLDSVLPRVVTELCWCVSLVAATLFIISYSTPLFIITIVPVGFIYYFVQRYYIATSRQLCRLESVSRSPIYNHFGESVSGAMSIRAYNCEERFIYESEERIDRNLVCSYPSLIAQRWLAIRLDMAGNFIILFSALFAVLGRDWISSGIAGLSVSNALQVTEIFNLLVRFTSDVENNIVSAERIKEYVDTTQEASWETDGRKVRSCWPERGEIEVKDFKVRYREGLDCVLKGISFHIKAGEKIGVVGRTGAGKSSLTLSLFRIIEPAAGCILIDDLDIATLGLHTLRSRLTIIPQDPVLFSGSLRSNLDPFGRHTDEQVWRALELAHLKHFAKGTSAGLHYQVSEGGDNLSVGQRQLICLARALLRKSKVLILDEATAAVDLQTDDLIQKTIRSEFNSSTVLTIAHRINTIMDSDKVIVLSKGLVVEFDSPENLLKCKKSIFFSMAHDAGLV